MAVRLNAEHSKNRCLHCNARVNESFRRVYGDNEDRAHRCRECDSDTRLGKGTAAGREVELPDPQLAPGRGGDGDERWSP